MIYTLSNTHGFYLLPTKYRYATKHWHFWPIMTRPYSIFGRNSILGGILRISYQNSNTFIHLPTVLAWSDD